MISNFFVSEPNWVAGDQVQGLFIPAHINDWLKESGSLTLRMKSSLNGDFDVLVEGEGFSSVFSQDADKLQQDPQDETFVREVVLTLSGKPRVFARTTIPLDSLHALEKLTTLGNNPLGEVIFSYPDLKRISLDFARIGAKFLLPRMIIMLGKENAIWARRSVYDIKGHRFIVSEFFLPAMF